MKTSETIIKISEALAKFQGALKPALKDAENPHFRSRYADLASIWDAIRGPMSENGLHVLQMVGTAEGKTTLTTRVGHVSGEWIESTWEIPVGKQDPQGYGSAISYARRYAIAACLGVVQDDDDGNAAMPVGRDLPKFEADKALEEIHTAASRDELQAVFAKYYKLASSARDTAAINVMTKAKDLKKEELAASNVVISKLMTDSKSEPKKYELKRPVIQKQTEVEREWK